MQFLQDAIAFLFSRQMILITVFALMFIFICIFEGTIRLLDARKEREYIRSRRRGIK